jgi:aminoglycoside phosphotransferase (APT) family kinase protein
MTDPLAEIARRHRIDPAAIAASPAQGIATRVYLLGDHLVLRIARPETADDLRKEALVIPAAVSAGVRTPEMIEFDDDLLDTPYMIVKRANGITPGLPESPADERWGAVYRRLGVELAALHRNITDLPAATVDESSDPRPDVEKLGETGYLSTDLAEWLIAWFDRLEDRRGADGTVQLIHGDASPQNLLVDPETKRLNAILDWGDAAWADPATEFAKLPLRAVPTVLSGFLDEPDETWAARILWHHLHWAVGRLASPPDPRAAHWSAQPGNRLLEIMRFFNADPPSPWADLR